MLLSPELTSGLETVKGPEPFGITSANHPCDSRVVELMSTLARLATEGNVICDVGTLVNYVSTGHTHADEVIEAYSRINKGVLPETAGSVIQDDRAIRSCHNIYA
jgi:CCR4-NOT transcription complex subunit 1